MIVQHVTIQAPGWHPAFIKKYDRDAPKPRIKFPFYKDKKRDLYLPLECSISYVQSNHSSSTGSNTTVLIGTVTAGNYLAGCAVTSGSGNSVSSVTDDKSNPWTKKINRNFQSGAGGIEYWEAPNAAAGSTTVTWTFNTSVTFDAHNLEYSGIATSTPFDQQAVGNASSGTAVTTASSGTTAQASELLIGFCAHGDGSFTAGSSYTVRSTGAFASDVEDRVVSSTGTYVADGTLASSANWNVLLATVKGAGGGGVTVFTLPALGVGN